MIVQRLLLYGLIVFIPFIFIFKSCKQFGQLPREKVLWYQDFKSNPKFNQDTSIDTFPKFSRNYYNDRRLLAYFTPNGEITHKVFIDRQSVASIRNQGYIIFKKFGNQLNYYDAAGRSKWSYTSFTYPLLSPQRNNIFLITTDSTTIAMIDTNQKELIASSYVGTFITDVSFCPFNDNVGVGTIDGKVFFYGGRMGDKKFEYQFNGSEHNYVKSLFCSYSGNHLLVLNGLKLEKLTLFDGLGRLLWEQNTSIERRTKTSLLVDEANDLIYDERDGEVYLLDLQTGTTKKKLNLKTKPKYTLFSSSLNYLLVGEHLEDRQMVRLYNLTTDKVEWQRSYKNSTLRYIELLQKNGQLNILLILEGLIYSYQLSNTSL